LLKAFVAATYIDNIAVSNSYGRLGLHERSHGETFFAVLEQKFQCNRLFLPDEPEAALSPPRELAFLVLPHDTLHKHKDANSSPGYV
jgi:predicted ATPase